MRKINLKAMNLPLSKIVYLLILVCLSFQFNDTDIYYMIPTGRYIIEHGFPTINPFITTSGMNIVVQNWLYCYVIAVIYDHLHSVGLWLFTFTQLLLTSVVTFKFLRSNKYGNKHETLVNVFATTFIIMFSYTNARPEMLTYILIMAEIFVLERGMKENNYVWFYFIPFITFIEANVHVSYWVMHIIVLIPYICKLTEKQGKQLFIPFLLSIQASVLTPYESAGCAYAFNSLKSGVFKYITVNELQSFALKEPKSLVFIALTIFFAYLVYKKVLSETEILMYIGFSALFIMSPKWLAFYALGCLYIFRAYLSSFAEDKEPIHINLGLVSNYCVILSCLIGVVTFYNVYDINKLSTKTDTYMNESTKYTGFDTFADYLDVNDPNASVYADFDYGNYFEFRGYKVHHDARPELYSIEISGSDEVLKELVIASKGYNPLDPDYNFLTSEEYGEVIDNINVDYFAVYAKNMLYEYLDSHPDKYQLVVDNTFTKLYKRI